MEPSRFFGRAADKQLFNDYLEGRAPLQHTTWVVSGRPSFGKSSFAEWCEYEAQHRIGEVALVSRTVLEKPIGRKEGCVDSDDNEIIVETCRRLFRRAYQSLLEMDNIYRARGDKSPIRRWNALAQHDLANLGFLVRSTPWVQAVFREMDPFTDLLLKFVELSQRCVRGGVARFVFIVDDVFPHQLGAIAQLARNIATLGEFRNAGIPPVLLIAVCQPGWEDAFPEGEDGSRRRVTERIQMRPFDLGEFYDYVLRELREVEWTADDSFLSALNAYTGRLPRLVNLVGNAAARVADQQQAATISGDHVERAVAANRALRERAIDQFMPGAKELVREPASARALEALSSTDGFPSASIFQHTSFKGMLERQWLAKMKAAVGKRPEEAAACEALWKELLKLGIVHRVPKADKYVFVSELVRRSLADLVS